EQRRGQVRRVESLARKAVLAQLVRTDLLLAVEIHRHRQRSGGQGYVSGGDQSQPGRLQRAEQRGSAAHSLDGRPDRGSAFGPSGATRCRSTKRSKSSSTSTTSRTARTSTIRLRQTRIAASLRRSSC